MPPRQKAKPNRVAENSTAQEAEPTSDKPSAKSVARQVSSDVPSVGNEQLKRSEGGESSESPGRAGADSVPTAPGTPRSTKSWYGSWPRNQKAVATAEVANESIAATGTSTTKATAKARAPRDSPQQMQRKSQSFLSPARSSPITATTTKLNISSDGLEETNGGNKSGLKSDGQSSLAGEHKDRKESGVPQSSTGSGNSALDSAPGPAHNSIKDNNVDKPMSSSKSSKSIVVSTKGKADEPQSTDTAQEQGSSTWMNWFGRNDSKIKEIDDGATLSKQPKPRTVEELPNKKDNATNQPATNQPQEPEIPDQRRSSDPNPQPVADVSVQHAPSGRSSWLGLWGAKPSKSERTASLLDPKVTSKDPSVHSTQSSPLPTAKTSDKIDPEELATIQSNNNPGSSEVDNNGSSWAFWSRAPNNASKDCASTRDSVGQLAVAGSPTQSKPEEAVVGAKGVPKTAVSANTSLGKRNRPASVEFQVEDDKKTKTSKAFITDARGNSASGAAASDKPGETRPTSRGGDTNNNLLLPLFKQTYPTAPDKWSLLQQIGRLFYGKPPPAPHPGVIKEPVHIKNALAIGVHGYFPAALIQTVIGRPTGTSVKFAEYTAQAIHRYTESKGYTPKTVEKIALEGEGKIEERLDILWKLLLNWIGTIRKADFIVVACHSQGVPVAISLVAKLIGFGCVNGARIGICAMAGVNLGPFVDYKSRFIGGSAGELFEFARSDSRVSQEYEIALDTVVRFGGKVTYIGSLDDQLVSLHSSTFGTAQHPHIYRAVWIDGRLHVPDFLTHLVGFALKLRNLGVSEHGLIRELSNPLAGNLVGGEGHSRLYEDSAVYDLAVEFILETTVDHSEPLRVDKPPPVVTQNPYILPFALRGLLEEDFVRKELSKETLNLLKQFDDWKPTTKVLRDVKYRLEGIRSKL